MRKTKKILTTCVALAVAAPSFGKVRLGSRIDNSPGIGSSTNGTSQDRPYTSEPARDATVSDIKCDKGNAVSYDFITSLTGKPVELETKNGEVIVNIPEYFNGCIDKINLSSKVGTDNNLYLKFDIKPSPEMAAMPGDTLEIKYENCIDELKKSRPELIKDGVIDYNVADKQGFITRGGFKKAVSFSGVDSSRDSEVLVVSPQSSSVYNATVFSNVPNGLGDSTEAKWNCMKTESPQNLAFRLYQTEKTRLLDQAEAVCKNPNASLHDVDAIREDLLKADTLGNFTPLIQSLNKMKYNLLKEEVDEMAEKLDNIEDKFQPSEEDVEEGKKIGVSKSEAKKLGKEYEALMKRFNDELLPQIKNDLKVLLAEREDADDDRKEAIDEEIKKLSELISVFNRENSERGDKFVTFIRGLKEANMKSATKESFEAVVNAQLYKRVYEGDTDDRGTKISLAEAETKSKQMSNDKYLKTVNLWDDERQLKSGSSAPIERRRKVLAELYSRSQQERKQFQSGFQSQQEYIQQYMTRGDKAYCGDGLYSQSCQNWMQRKTQLYSGFQSTMQNKNRQFMNEWSNKYGNAITQQQNLISSYQTMSDQYQAAKLRNQMANGNLFGTESYTGNYDYSFFDVGNSATAGLDFMPYVDFSGAQVSQPMQQMQMFPQQQQIRAPAAGGSTFTNPYQYQGYR
ncbi:hypothetical protein [Bacteriovorax sp. Seq25_V]|uniref:hypothetical protein n=1 Tax=Bacteriovorax sp. Seq25_V TaxID=1201288 RepID=UPI00038A19B2|nr:hypothetical protein [Bacteriovorax sp. Seq25_V]EQC43255.1 hypothetical protein M900_2797 [Bacteriovorax sp. Seq25_V]